MSVGSTARPTCFVIMPFDRTTDKHTKEYWQGHWNFLRSLIEESGHEARRSEPLRGDILRQIITDLVTVHVVVADLTDWNPNVFWELGVRQSFKHGTITIAEEGTELPFDVDKKGTLFDYPADHVKNAVFNKQFKEALDDCVKNPNTPDSHVLETLSGRGTLFEIFRRDEAIRRLTALSEECDFNLAGIRHVMRNAKKNQENPENRSYTTSRLRCAALDLLATTRYIEEESSFYESLTEIFFLVESMNSQLNVWEHEPDSVEKWFLDTIPRLEWQNKLETLSNKTLDLIERLNRRT